MLSTNLQVESVIPFPAPPGIAIRPPKTVPQTRPALGVVETGAWGTRMAKHLQVSGVQTLSVLTRQRAQLAVTRLRSQAGVAQRSAPFRPEQAFVVQLHLQTVSSARFWLQAGQDGVSETPREGSVGILDLSQNPSFHLEGAFDILQFYIPRAALDEFADENDARRTETLRWPLGKIDVGLMNLASCLLPALEEPSIAGHFYADHLLLAMRAYVARNYGGISATPAVVRGGLAPWQLHRATETMKANLDGQVSLAQLAGECKLSVSHFVRAFKQTVGEPPYRWLLRQRMESAKELLLHSGLPMVEIALKCGFADQACFIRAFRKISNATPGEWRRMRLQ